MFGEKEASSSSPATYCCPQHQENEWRVVQDSLKTKLIIQDDFHWRLLLLAKKEETKTAGKCDEILKYVGGVDLSFSKDDPSVACGTLVVLDIENLNVVYQDSSVVKLHVPYIPGFLAFREVLIPCSSTFRASRENEEECQSTLPPGFGLACHLGVLADLPTIGIGKNLHHVDGLTVAKVRQLLEENSSSDILTLIGDSGCTYGAAMWASEGSLKPIFVSIGHRISLATAVNIVKTTCRFRIPEPIRQADIRSKVCLQKLSDEK